MPVFGPGLHEYTSGRYLFNEQLRLQERHLKFNVHELANVICSTVGRPLAELKTIEKFAEGGFNRMLQATSSDGREILARLPFRLEAPLQRSVASEAATLSYLHREGIPVPRVLGYSSVLHNPVSLENKAVARVMKQIVDLEQRFMSLAFPACGSLFFQRDLQPDEKMVPLSETTADIEPILVGPITKYAWEYGKRASLKVDRGPWTDFLSCFEAGAKRELAFCNEHGQPRLNVERYLRELDNFEMQQPNHHAQLLQDLLRMSPYLSISPESPLSRPTLRHPDLSPDNILINDHDEIVGILDWQHTVIMPLTLCAGIPHHFQNWGDLVSESLSKPDTKVPLDFETLSPAEQEELRETMRRQLVHFYYGALSLRRMEAHYNAFRNENAMLRAKLYNRTSAPWEGSSVDLQHVLVQAQQQWPLELDGSSRDAPATCPVQYDAEGVERWVSRAEEEEEKLSELDDMRAMLGTDSVGWVPTEEHSEQAKEMREAMKRAFLKECETDAERKAVRKHFAFDDHDEN